MLFKLPQVIVSLVATFVLSLVDRVDQPELVKLLQ